jgi:hypothetical protein
MNTGGVLQHQLDDGTDLLVRQHRIKLLRLPGTGDVSNSALAVTWRQRATKHVFHHPVVLVMHPDVSTAAGDSPPSIHNWVYATPHDTPHDESILPGSLGVADHFGAHIVAIRSQGGILVIPSEGEWDLYYPDDSDALFTVFDGRNPAFVQWVSTYYRVAHALSFHPVDDTIPQYNGTAPSIVEVAPASRWRAGLWLQNVGPDPETVAADPDVDPPIRLWTTTLPTDSRGFILYPRETLKLELPNLFVAQAWSATGIGGATKLGVTAWV